mmetsp:Transcript_35421/g.35929  ORF Transcript_35421/g.35929 Transcript_35421/m.35929 type:complete len:96 (-) Transcript_35421:80-367(-)
MNERMKSVIYRLKWLHTVIELLYVHKYERTEEAQHHHTTTSTPTTSYPTPCLRHYRDQYHRRRSYDNDVVATKVAADRSMLVFILKRFTILLTLC